MRASLAILVALLGLALSGIALRPAMTLAVTTDGGRVLACARVRPGDSVTLTFTHSMYGGEVRETYRITTDGTLRRERVVADRAAAAEYYAWDGGVAAVAGGYEVIAPPFTTSSLAVRVDARGAHRLTVDGRVFALADAVREPTRVRIEVTADGCE